MPSSLFHNFKRFNIRVTAAHHPVIQREVDELLAKGAIEPLTYDARFHTNVYVVPKLTGDL